MKSKAKKFGLVHADTPRNDDQFGRGGVPNARRWKAAHYARTDRAGPAGEQEIERQLTACRNFVLGNDGDIWGEFVDRCSGRVLVRSGLRALVEASRLGEFAEIVVYDLSALGDTEEVTKLVLDLLSERGLAVNVASVRNAP